MPSDYEDDDEFGDDSYGDDEGFGEEDGFSEVNFDDDESDDDYGDEWSDEAIGLKSGSDDEDDAASEDEPADEVAEATPAAGSDPLADTLAALLGAEITSAEPPPPDDQLAWRETYFVLFQHHDRPTLTQVEAAIGGAGGRLVMENLTANDDGLFQSVLIQAPEDNAALEVSYEEGEAVMLQSAELAKQLQKQLDSAVLAELLRSDARLDVMHFERMDESATFDMDEPDEIGLEALNPATLIGVVEALASLTGGVPIDPASGEVLL